MTDASSEPIVIVGSRLQALIAAGVGIALVAGVGLDQWWWTVPLAMLCGLTALTIFVRRAELGETEVTFRRALLGTATAPRHQVRASCGHRYLRLAVGDARPGRIEVPVEIRPEVKAWADTTGDGDR